VPPASDEVRIRKGLKFLFRASSALIKAAAQLEQLHGNTAPPTVADLLKACSLEAGGATYRGKLTQQQHDYLKTQTGSVKQLADAIAKIIIRMDGKVLDAGEDLSKALAPPRAPKKAAVAESAIMAGNGTGARVGCCTYDATQQNGITQSFCEGGLQGTWAPGLC
jgi:hypothetical protein